ncbi:MAG: glycosyltransferase [Pseudomonadota bacterium]
MSDTATKILFVAHDAYRAGGTLFLLNMVRWLIKHSSLDIAVALRAQGEMVQAFAEVCPTFVLSTASTPRRTLRDRVRNFLKGTDSKATPLRDLQSLINQLRPDLLYLNTITQGDLLEGLELANTKVLSHVHELPSAIRQYGRGKAHVQLHASDHIIGVSNAVTEHLARQFASEAHKIERIYGFVPVDTVPSAPKDQLRTHLLGPLGIEPNAWVIGFCGHGNIRKGADLAVPFARLFPTHTQGRPIHFVWLGANAPEYPFETAQDDLRRAGLAGRMHFVGVSKTPADWISTFDLHVLLAREDSFPLVVMEAASLGVPTVCFDQSGGAPEFVREDAGRATPYMDLPGMAEAVMELLSEASKMHDMGEVAKHRVRTEHAPDVILPRILDAIYHTLDQSRG